MNIAEVIINTEVRSLDRVYHYVVPENIKAAVGMRVSVPFGFGNRTEIGYIVGFTESSPFENLKAIKKLIDKEPIISEKGIELARYLRRTCLCPMSEAFKLLLPPRVNFKFEKIVSLCGGDADGLTLSQKKIFDTLKAIGGTAEYKKLLESCGLKSSAALTALKNKGLVSVTEKAVGGNKEKIRKRVCLAVSKEEAAQTEGLGKAMQKVLDLLMEYDSMLLSELIDFAKCSASSVKALESRGLVITEDVAVLRSPIKADIKEKESLPPTDEQKNAIDTLKKAVDFGEKSEYLLFGVTGSGKTEVFLQAVDYCISRGKNAIVLVPEISLTPQMTRRFAERFGGKVAVLHSGLSLGERYDEWNRIRSGEVNVAVGARSAIFAPFENIGLIVVDEEHEDTYKSENSPRYDARIIAAFRAFQHNCPVVYASATPRIDDYYAALNGKINLLELTKRYNNVKMPDVYVADMAAELKSGNRSVYSMMAQEEIEKNLAAGEQSIVFLNRRGFSTFVSCRSCGYVAKCPNCSVSLTFHSKTNSLKCHMCGHTEANPVVCPSCGSKYIKYFGAGTQKAEEELFKLFPNITVERMDADTTSHKFSHERILDKFNNEKSDVLLGTQMITKGLDFPNVTLSIVLAADTLLNTGSYRASERAFSQLVQVCGRAGRGEKSGRCIIQTYEPGNKVIAFATKNDYKGFYSDEIKSRQMMDYPPFSDIVQILVTGTDEQKTGEYGMTVEKNLRKLLDEKSGLCKTLFGLCPAPVFKVKNKFRYKIVFYAHRSDDIYEILEKLYNIHIDEKTSFGLEIDINPTS